MEERTICFILIGLFVFLFCFAIIVALYYGHKTQKELSGQSGVYKGPAGKPKWNGILPKRVEDYVRPRYVYENLVESVDYVPENGRIIGYRISPELVIHSRVQSHVTPPTLYRYLQRLGGRLLSPDEVAILLGAWHDLSDLRKKAGDDALDCVKFWCCSKEGLPVCAKIHNNRALLQDMIGFAKFDASLILKR